MNESLSFVITSTKQRELVRISIINFGSGVVLVPKLQLGDQRKMSGNEKLLPDLRYLIFRIELSTCC